MVMSEKQSEMNEFAHRSRVKDFKYKHIFVSVFLGGGGRITNITSYAVAPGQQSQPQHSVAETQHHTEHVQKTDHFWGRRTDQHCTHHEAQKSKQLEREKDKNLESHKQLIQSGNKTCFRAVIGASQSIAADS